MVGPVVSPPSFRVDAGFWTRHLALPALLLAPLLWLAISGQAGQPGMVFFAGLAAYLAIAMLVVLVVYAWKMRGRQRLRMTGPSLTLLVCAAWFMTAEAATRAMEARLAEIAATVQARCDADKRCPESIPLGERLREDLWLVRLDNGSSWYARCNADITGFELKYCHFADICKSIRGGVGYEPTWVVGHAYSPVPAPRRSCKTIEPLSGETLGSTTR